jgi:RNA polymerase sigma factor (sigma-70 family)
MKDTEFWDIVYRDHAPALLGVLRRYVKDAGVAQDLLHEMFITAINRRDTYTGKGPFGGWLYRIAVNTALMHLRDEKIRQVPAEAVLTVAGDDDGGNRADDARAAIEAAEFSGEELLSAIDRLPEHHRVVFNMYVMDSFSHRQIAAELDISPGTSKSHLARARRKIQQFLYDEALNRKRKGVRRRASAFMLLFPATGHYIDGLYREGLSDFRILPTGGADFLSAALEQTAAAAAASTAAGVSQAVSVAAFWGARLSYVAVCCGTAAITASTCWVAMSENSPLNRGTETVAPAPAEFRIPAAGAGDSASVSGAANHSAFVQTDSTAAEINTLPVPSSISEAKPTPEPAQGKGSGHGAPAATGQSAQKPNNSVVVKKQIIQHQTVVVRDTVIIIE